MEALFGENREKSKGVTSLFNAAAKFNENFIHELSVVAENTIEIDSCKYSKIRDNRDVTFYRCVNLSNNSRFCTLCTARAASKNVDGRIVGLVSPYDIHTCNLRYRRKIPRIALNSEVSILPPGNDFVASDQLPSTSTDFVQSDQRPSTSTDFVSSDQRPSTLSGNVNPFYHQYIIEDDAPISIPPPMQQNMQPLSAESVPSMSMDLDEQSQQNPQVVIFNDAFYCKIYICKFLIGTSVVESSAIE